MNSKIYRQVDSRWGNLPYPSKPYTVARSGCGLCSVVHCIIEEPEYENRTPKTEQPYMKQFATRGHGTTWNGITTALKHYGYTVKEPNIGSTMKTAWNILPRSMKRGVLLFKAGRAKDGSCYTNGGHYIAYVDFKVDSKGKHWFKLKDSSGRANDGWKCYENSIAGLVPKIWVCMDFHGNYPKLKNKSGYEGVIPSPTLKKGSSEKTKTKQWQKFLNWTFGINLKVDGIFGKKTELYTKYFQKNCGLIADGIVGKLTVAKARSMQK